MNDMKNRAFEAKESYKHGFISRKEAKEIIMPYIEAFNQKSKEIAAKYGMRPKAISFAGFLR